MSNDETRLAKAAARILRDDAEEASQTSTTGESRAAAIAAMTRVMRQRKQQKRLRFGFVAGVAVAASLVLAFGIRSMVVTTKPTPVSVSVSAGKTGAPVVAVAASFVKGTPMIVRGVNGEHIMLTEGTPLQAGDHLIVREGSGSRMTIGFAQGTHVAIDDHAELEMKTTMPATSFHLASGSVRADVAKLLPGERFVISTADAEVEVHGTSFEVTRVKDAATNCSKATRVRVREGVVAVRSEGKETLVRANEVWPSCDAAAATPAAPAAPVTPSTSVAATDTSSVVPTPAMPAAHATPQNVKPSDLAAQNDLFEAAISKKRAGETRGAITAFEDLLARYPQSHLAQSARAERMKLLRSIDRTQARTAATDYLKRYPTGFARHDAEVILSD